MTRATTSTATGHLGEVKIKFDLHHEPAEPTTWGGPGAPAHSYPGSLLGASWRGQPLSGSQLDWVRFFYNRVDLTKHL